jgi:ABC-type multidrug transport system fused ATPase/permease subunit
MLRSILVTEIFSKTTVARIGNDNDDAALTLMSTDMERIRVGFRSLHELWAGIIQAALAAWMLYNRLGVVFVAPIGLVIVFFTALGILVNAVGTSQRAWMAGVQKRVGLTATVIASMKNLKLSGLSTTISSFLQQLRVEELAAGARFRKIIIATALLGYGAQLIGPPLTFAFTRQKLDASTVFTSLTFIALFTYPLSLIFESAPQVVSALACLSRIQAFLESETRYDCRQILADQRRNDEKSLAPTEDASDSDLVIQSGRFGWEVGKFVLQDVNTRVVTSSLTIVVGPVGSGKSTFCKALLGEIPFSEGNVVLRTRFARVGFCEQTAFLMNGSIKENIVGYAPFENDRYSEVINATALGFDLATLPQGDQTNVGSDGITLSGGQKQRVALARALYLQSDLLVLDDVFSGLDADTEERVFQQVFAPGGLLRRRRATVVLCTHSIKHLPAADYIMVLGDGTIAEQGSFPQLMTSDGYVQRLGLKDSSDDDTSAEEITSQQLVESSRPQSHHISAVETPLASDTDQLRQVGDKTVYKHYAKSMGWFLAALSLFFGILWGFFTNFPTICELTSIEQKKTSGLIL